MSFWESRGPELESFRLVLDFSCDCRRLCLWLWPLIKKKAPETCGEKFAHSERSLAVVYFVFFGGTGMAEVKCLKHQTSRLDFSVFVIQLAFFPYAN